MTLIEILVFLTLSAILTLLPAKFNGFLKQKLDDVLQQTQENHEALHALELISRSIRQAGFTHMDSSHASQNKKSSMKGMKIRKNSGLSNAQIGQFIDRKHTQSANQSDAMTIYHASHGHIDCLGHQVDEKRRIHQLGFHGYFVQWMGNAQKGSGMLMCQSLNNRGHLQNDGILSGVKRIHFDPIIEGTHKEDEMVGVLIYLEMLSGQRYEHIVSRRNL